MIQVKPENYWVLITDPSGKKKLYEANLQRGEAEGMAAGINMAGKVAGQIAEAVGFFPVAPAPTSLSRSK